jgi:histidinol-phosphatase (PHP family)
MTLTSMHTHTEFCDGTGDVESFCRAAHERGFASIGFSAHAPVEKAGLSTDWHLPEQNLSAYLEAVRAARRRWEGKLTVFLGMEVDYIAGRMGPSDPLYRRDLGLDYLIGSVHYVPDPKGGEPVAVDGSAESFARYLRELYDGDAEALMAAYWQAVGEMIRAGGFDIVGHLDLIKKNNPGDRWFSRSGSRYREGWETCISLLEPGVALSEGVVVEVNTGGLNRKRITETYPAPDILAALVRHHIPLLITADAHETDHLGGNYETARALLRDAGCTALRVFEGRAEDGPVWRGELLDGYCGQMEKNTGRMKNT